MVRVSLQQICISKHRYGVLQTTDAVWIKNPKENKFYKSKEDLCE